MSMKDKVKQYVCEYFEKQLLPACYDSLVDFYPVEFVEKLPSYEDYVQRVHDRMTGNYHGKEYGDEENQ